MRWAWNSRRCAPVPLAFNAGRQCCAVAWEASVALQLCVPCARAPTRSKDPDTKWYGQVHAFLSYQERGRRVRSEAAYVRWYVEVAHSPRTALLGWPRLKWSREPGPGADGRTVVCDYYDLIPLADINRPVLIQPDPTGGDAVARQRFFVNPFVH